MNSNQLKDKLSKAQGGKMTEVEENDLELEGGMFDQGTPKFERNQINDPLRIKSAHFEIT